MYIYIIPETNSQLLTHEESWCIPIRFCVALYDISNYCLAKANGSFFNLKLRTSPTVTEERANFLRDNFESMYVSVV